MNKFIVVALLVTVALIGISEAKSESRFLFRKPWIPLPPINNPPATTNPGTTNPAPPPATSCTIVEGCIKCNDGNDNKCDTAPGEKGACYMEYCDIDPDGKYCARGCQV